MYRSVGWYLRLIRDNVYCEQLDDREMSVYQPWANFSKPLYRVHLYHIQNGESNLFIYASCNLLTWCTRGIDLRPRVDMYARSFVVLCQPDLMIRCTNAYFSLVIMSFCLSVRLSSVMNMSVTSHLCTLHCSYLTPMAPWPGDPEWLWQGNCVLENVRVRAV